MSKFYQALQRAEQEKAFQARQPLEALTEKITAPLVSRRSEHLRKERAEENLSKERRPVPLPLVPSSLEKEWKIEGHLIGLLTLHSFEAEQYRTLCHLIEQLHEKTSLCVIAVSSATVGDGKTTTSINLAGTLTQTFGARVLLVDFDLRRPSIATYLGKRKGREPGIIDLVRDPNLALGDLVVSFPSLPNLGILHAGEAITDPYETLKSFQIEEIVTEARRHYDYVIIDTPPMVPFPDCRLLERVVDGFLLVVAAHKTPRKLIEEAITTLNPSKMVGLVFNKNDGRSAWGYSDYDAYNQYHAPQGGTGKNTLAERILKKWQSFFQNGG